MKSRGQCHLGDWFAACRIENKTTSELRILNVGEQQSVVGTQIIATNDSGGAWFSKDIVELGDALDFPVRLRHWIRRRLPPILASSSRIYFSESSPDVHQLDGFIHTPFVDEPGQSRIHVHSRVESQQRLRERFSIYLKAPDSTQRGGRHSPDRLGNTPRWRCDV